MEADAVCPTDSGSRGVVVQTLKEMRTGKAFGHSDVSLWLIAVGKELGIQLMVEICQRIYDGLGMPAEWNLTIVIQIFKGICEIRDCSCYGDVKFL